MKKNNKYICDEDEYNYIKSINKELNINSIYDYNQKKDIHKYFIEDPETYFRRKGIWRNWYDFLGIDTSIFIQNKEDWIKFCKEKNIINLEIYYENCKIYKELPLYPDIIYRNFSNINNELGEKKYRRNK